MLSWQADSGIFFTKRNTHLKSRKTLILG